MEILTHFHFLRPEWLLLAPGLLILERLLRSSQANSDRFSGIIDPELLQHLRVQKPPIARFNPTSVLVIIALLLTLIMAGPSWQQQPSPLAEDAAPLVVVLDVSESMATTDVAPSRLLRGIQKIRDLLELVPDKRVGVIAYAGSAHTVLPLTSDHEVTESFLAVMTPGITPRAGKYPEYALSGIDRLLAQTYYKSSVLLVTDGLGAGSSELIKSWCQDRDYQLLIYGLGDPSVTQSTVPLEREALSNLATQCSGQYFDASIDRRDVAAIAGAMTDAYKVIDDEALPWRDNGYPLVFPVLILVLLWFRRGWTRLWIWLLVPCLITFSNAPIAQLNLDTEMQTSLKNPPEISTHGLLLPALDGFVSLWLTPDQYGHILLQLGYYQKAAEIFENPIWRATARYYHQDFEQAATLFTRQDNDVALFNEANARAHRRDYVGARNRYDLLLDRNPEFPGASANREFIHEIIETSNRLSESQTNEAGVGSETLDQDTDPQIGEGADTLVNEVEERTQYSAEAILASPETAALWMKNVQPDPANFLRSKFNIQLQERGVSEQ
ncbi:MAG: VWA domain-containing protein [Luminiphilus sp.]|nr:VWA domain-containing protein [Luminiphilus sp.]MDG1460298.1 VWA domain-containing protein [Luminiphilus sp.]